jgi:hypothetical protein
VPVLEVATGPPQPSLPLPPPAVQLSALLLVQARLLEAPDCNDEGVAVKLVMDAAGGVAVTVTLTELGALVPPAPLHVKVYVSLPVALIGPTLVPVLDTGCAPPQPSAPVPPLAVQAVAPLLDQASNVDCPL